MCANQKKTDFYHVSLFQYDENLYNKNQKLINLLKIIK